MNLIVASPRSGTRFTAAVLSSVGQSWGHEMPGLDGMVSGLAPADDFYYLGKDAPRTSTVDWGLVFHQTRHPLLVIPSLATAMRINFWHWQQGHSGVAGDLEPKILRAALFWVSWVSKCDALSSWQYRVEDFEKVWPELCGRIGVDPCREIPAVSARSYTSGAERIEWGALRDIDIACHDAVRKAADRYGYE